MIIDTVFFVGIDQITLPVTQARGERIFDQYYITTDKRQIDSIVRPYLSKIGELEYIYLTHQASGLMYRRSKLDIKSQSVSDALADMLIFDLRHTQLFLLNAWIVKDSAAHHDRGWIAGELVTGTVVNNNVWATRYSRPDGSFSDANFSLEEFRRARTVSTKPGIYLSRSSNDRNTKDATPHQAPESPAQMRGNQATLLTSNSLRYQRFTYFIQAARSTIDVAIKIAQYCSALEALVSNASSELSHQVSERIACILEPIGQKRFEIFFLIKEAYGYRSKAVHGAHFKQKQFRR